MAYKLFHNKAAKFGAPQLTIRNGRIGFNAFAGDILAKVGMQFAHLLWDGDEHKIAIRPTTKEDENAFKVTIAQGKRGGAITASSFLKYIGWQNKKPVVVDAHWSDASGLLEAVLPKEYLAPNASAEADGNQRAERTKRRRHVI